MATVHKKSLNFQNALTIFFVPQSLKSPPSLRFDPPTDRPNSDHSIHPNNDRRPPLTSLSFGY